MYYCPGMKYGRVVDIPTIRRFLSKVQVVGDSDCWNWTACRTRKGYGRFHIAGQTRWAHRISYAIFVGDIPDELTVDHMCFNPSCCRPDHLRLVSPNQNSSHKQSREAGDDSDEILI